MPIVYLDEVAFTKRTITTRCWSGRNTQLKVDQNNLYSEYRSVIATVSSEVGTVLIDIKDFVNNNELMLLFVQKLSRKMNRRPFVLYMD